VGLTRLDGQPTDRPSGEAAAMMVPARRDGSHHVAVVEVRRGSIRSTFDGKEAIHWSGDFSRLSGAPVLRMSREGGLGIGSAGGDVTFYRATVREISGPGLFVSSGLATAGDEGSKITADDLKEVAEWATSQRGFVVVESGGLNRKIDSLEDLPGPADHLVEFELPGTRPSAATPPGVLKILVASTSLKRLAPRNSRLSVADFAKLLHDKPQLRSMSLDGNSLDDSIVDSLLRLPMLESLGLSKNKAITGRSLDKLAVLTKLNILSLGDTSITDANLPAIARNKGLKSLYLNGTKVTNAGMTALRPLTQLEDIRLKGTVVTPQGLKALQSAPKLRHIEMPVANGAGDLAELAAIGAGFGSVTELNLDFRGPKENESAAQLAHVGELASFTALRKLEMWGPPTVSASAIAGLPNLSKLETLQVDFGFTADDLAVLKGSKTLRSLRLPNAKLTEDGALKLAGFAVLTEIARSSFTEAGLKAFKEYRPEVRILD
jgi:hypothetical protein